MADFFGKRFKEFSPTFCLLLISLSSVYGFLDALEIGDQLRGTSAHSLSLGRTAIASNRNSNSIFTNPAILSQMKTGGEISVSPSFSSLYYHRTHPDTQSVSDSRTLLYLDSFSAGARHPKFPLLTVALGWNTLSNFDFDFEEKTTRNRNDQENSGFTPGIDSIKTRGNIAQWSAGFSLQPFKSISLGAAVLHLTGQAKSETTLLTIQTGQEPISQKFKWENEFLGDSFHTGIAICFSPTFTFAALFQPQFELQVSSESSFVQGTTLKNSAQSSSDFLMPERYGIGILYGFTGSEKNLLSVDLIMTHWEKSRLKVKSINGSPTELHFNPSYKETLEFHIGFEHLFKNNFPLRIGFYYLPDYTAFPATSTSFFTIGTGTEWRKFMVDFAGEFGKKTTLQERFFFSDQRDTVTDTRFKFLITITYRWQ